MKSPLLVPSFNESSQAMHSSRLGQIVFYGTMALLLFAPLAFGTVEPWSIFILEAGAASLFALWVIGQSSTNELHVVSNPLFLPMLFFAFLVGVQLVSRHTAYLYATRSEAFLYCAYAILCFLVVQGFRRTRQVHILAWLFSIYGFAMAFFALIQSFSSDGMLYWFRTPRSGGWIYGPYVNHNHYAGLMEMLLPIPLVVSLCKHVSRSQKIMAATAAAIMATTIFLSGSRGGMVALVIELAILGGFLIRQQTGRKVALALGIFLAMVAGLLMWLGGGELTSRMMSIQSETRSELAGGLRLTIDRDGLKMFAQKPVIGWGLGVFPTVYPKYRSFYTNDIVNEAHNDYVQLLVEMGALGFAAALWFLIVAYSRAIKKLGDWNQNPNGAVAMAAMLGISGILIHSFVDFNLQIPANAALFYVLCVVAAMDPNFRASGRSRRRRSRPEIIGDELSA